MSDFKVQLLAPHTALVTYKTVRQSQPSRPTPRSSIWQLLDGRWEMIFHQGTVAEIAP